MKYATANKQELARLEEDAAAYFFKFIERIEKETGFYVLITDGKRTFEEQEALHKANPKNAKPGTSRHETGRAIDINLVDKKTGKYIRKADTLATWNATKVPAIAKEMGIRWGGDFKSYHDPVHFEYLTTSFVSHVAKTNLTLLLIIISVISLILFSI